MKSLFWIIGLFGLAVAVALGARWNEAYLLVVFPQWRIELTLNLALLLLALVFVGLYALVRLCVVAAGLPVRVRQYRAQRQRTQAAQVFQEAVRLLFEGRFGHALKKAAEAHAAGTAPGLSALVAARAAQRLREPEKQQDWLAHARNDDPATEAAALMLEAEMANEERRFDAALEALARLRGQQGRHLAALRLALRAHQGLDHWDDVLRLARQLAKRRALPGEVVTEVITQAHLGNLRQRRGDAVSLAAYLRELPDAERGRRVTLAAAAALLAVDAQPEAQGLIERVLADGKDAEWQSELLELYGKLSGGEQTARIARAESWLRRHPDDAGLLLALGRMCFRQKLWGKAQSYLEASLSLEASQAAHLELAHLFDQLERPEEANRHYRLAVGA